MSEAMRGESPLVERVTPARRAATPEQVGVTLRQRPFLGYVNLRGNSADTTFSEGVEGVVGVAPPAEPNTVVDGDRARAFWLGPNEWLLVTAAEDELEVRTRLEEALAGCSFATCDVTGYYTTVTLEGPHARDVLEKGCTLDLHPRAFQPGQCAQTLLSHAIILLRPIAADATGYELVVRRSFADYVFVWIDDAAEEFGMAVAD